jgi:predicted Zn-dependent protease
MQDYFYTLADFIGSNLLKDEIYLCEFSGEQSDFIRFNHGQVRQPGSVEQYYLELDLIRGNRHAIGQLTLSSQLSLDQDRLVTLLANLRDQLPHIPADPYLLYATEVQSTESIGRNDLPETPMVLADIIDTVQHTDFVGFYASGGTFTGFANSFGQRNWHSRYSFNLDWSLYYEKDKAVKSAYAGFNWEKVQLQNKFSNALTQLEILKYQPRVIQPGQYRVYLAPTALYEILQLLCWDGFGLKAQRTKETPLLRMFAEPKQTFHASVTLRENTTEGLSPIFQNQGFIKPNQVTLIQQGTYHSALVSPRSAKEYGITTNGANDGESPTSLDLAAGDFPQLNIVEALDTGIYINNLWYLNYSDRAAGRMTGMTRFATFWVEQGEIIAPLNVMRFDETVYHLLGSQLIALTAEREFIIKTDTYEKRSDHSARLPGALIAAVSFTL